ncbi:hypothetical protein GOBAR_DD23327 [Gossypium barbadense]|nr:hypothetical protein GOBAR_DD23327 [Gossypium barbadense]
MAALCYSLPSLTLKPSPLNPKPYPNIPFLSHPKPNLRLPKKPTTTITRMSLNPTPATDRLISVAAYSLPFFNSLQYGRYIFIQYPQLGILFDPILPFLSLYKSVPYASFVAFFALYLGVVRNPSFSHYVRFNSMQAVTLDVLLVVPLLLTRILNPGRVGILGRTPYLPFVADAADCMGQLDLIVKHKLLETEPSSPGLDGQKLTESSFGLEPREGVVASFDEYNNGHNLEPGQFHAGSMPERLDTWVDLCFRVHKKLINSRYGLDGQKLTESSFYLEPRDHVHVINSFNEYSNGRSLQPDQFLATERARMVVPFGCWSPHRCLGSMMPSGYMMKHLLYEELCPTIKNILLLDSEGKRIAVKYYSDDWPTNAAKEAFEKAVFTKTQKTNARTEAEITMFDNYIVVYKFVQDLHFFVTGGENENEIILATVLQGFFDAVGLLLRGTEDKKEALENLDLILLCLDEIVDGGIILETDANVIAGKVDSHSMDAGAPLSEQTITQALATAREHLTRSLLK